MARQIGHIKIRGTYDNICFYKMSGKYYARTKSSLSGKRVKKSAAFRQTRMYAGLMGKASKIGSAVYKGLPENFRQHWMYRAFAGEAFQLLKTGKSLMETKQILWQTYVSVWEQKRVDNQQSTVSSPKNTDPKKSLAITVVENRIPVSPSIHLYTPIWKKERTCREKVRLRRPEPQLICSN